MIRSKYLQVISVFCLTIIISGCEKSEDVNIPDFINEFSMELYPNYIKDSIAIAFTGYFSEDPTIYLNQVEIADLKTNNNYWKYCRIPYSKTVNYEIIVADEILTGSYEVPDELFGKIFCNGTELFAGITNNIEKSESYLFTWDKLDCNYYSLHIEDNGTNLPNITDTSFVVNNYDQADFNLLLELDYVDEKVTIEQDSWKASILSYFYKKRYIEFIE